MLNFNTKPYYDDFNEDKNFHRILFKPGVAVQARELTQAQSILQDQIGKFGKFVLSDGSIVSGGKYSLDTNVRSLNLQNTGNIATDIVNFDEKYVVGVTSRCVSLISDIDVLNYYITVKSVINGIYNYVSGEQLYIFTTKELAYRFLSIDTENVDAFLAGIEHYSATLNTDVTITVTGCSGQKDTFLFSIPTQAIKLGSILTAAIDNYDTNYIVTQINYDGTFLVNRKLKTDYNNTSIRILSPASNHVLEISIAEGIYFTNNAFVKALPQSIIPDARSQYPTCSIGLEVVETIVDYVDDLSLLDPAQGSYNYTAPGADRYKIYLNLVTKPVINGGVDQTAITTAKYIELIRVKNGIVTFDNTSPTLGALEDILAEQLYDHAGHFIISPFNVSFNQSDFNDKVDILHATVSPGKAYIFGYPFNATFPTNFLVNKARETAIAPNNIINPYYGNSIKISDITGSLPNPKVGAKIQLYSSKLSGDISSNTFLGYADIGNIDYVTENEYTINLYNVSVSEKTLAIANSIVGRYFSANTKQSSGVTSVTDADYNSLLFKLPYTNPAAIYNSTLTLDVFDTKSVTSNTVTISSGSLDKTFPCGLSTSNTGLSLELKNQNFIVVAKDTNGGYTEGEYIDLANVVILVAQVGSEYHATFNFTDHYNGQIDVKYSLTYSNPQPKSKTIHVNQVAKINAELTPTSMGYSDIDKLKAIYKADSNLNTFIGSWNSGTTYAMNDVIEYNGRLYSSPSANNSANPPTSSEWTELTDVTHYYTFNNGQKQFFYDHGTIAAKSIPYIGTVFAVFDYYSHSTSGEYISVDSYPVEREYMPTVNINTASYDLINYIDFRPRRQNESSNTSIITYDSYNIPSTITDANFYYDMTYYLGRIDKLVLTKEKKLVWLTGVSSYRNYIPPKDLPDALTLATITFNPYSADAKSILTTYTKHRRYTMDDIGKLDTRLKNVEYYTALNIAEKAALNTNIIDVYGARLKNGFIVDSFTNLNIVDLKENNKNISFDLDNNLVRPAFGKFEKKVYSNSVEYLGEKEKSLNNELGVGLVCFGYTGEIFVVQDQATGNVKINQFDSISYEGNLKLNPQSDAWVEQVGATIVTVNDDTKALQSAQNPTALIYNDWNSFYSSRNDYIIDKSSAKEITVDNPKTGGKTVYSVGTAIVGAQENTKDFIDANVIPKTRPIDIKFEATGLAPLTRMYVYVNGKFMSGYVKPNVNVKGLINDVNIVTVGDGYLANANVSINSSNNTTAKFELDLNATGGINYVWITNPGSGYAQQKYFLDIQNATTPGNTANVVVTTDNRIGSYLYTDEHGTCSGTLSIPNNDSIYFDAGELVVTVCDTPNLDIGNSLSKARAIFYSKYSPYQKTITSIREPYITFVREIDPPVSTPAPTPTPTPTPSGPGPTPPPTQYLNKLSVPSAFEYVWYYQDAYQTRVFYESGTIKIPVSIIKTVASNPNPTSDVTVHINLNANKDQSANVTASLSSTTLVFTPSEFVAGSVVVSKNVTLSYNLHFDNQSSLQNGFLGTIVEFYMTSDDPSYNYKEMVLPSNIWKPNATQYNCVAYSKLVAKSIPLPYVAPITPPALVKATLTLSNVTIDHVGGYGYTYATLSGTGLGIDEPGGAEVTIEIAGNNTIESSTLDGLYPQSGGRRTFTVVPGNASTRQIRFKVTGTTGTFGLNATATSSSWSYNGLTASASITVGGALPPLATDTAKIVVTSSSTDLVAPNKGYLNFHLSGSRAPTSAITVSGSSSVSGLSSISGYSNDTSTPFASGSTVSFSTTTYGNDHRLEISTLDPGWWTGTGGYTLTSSSSDSLYNGLTVTVLGRVSPAVPAPVKNLNVTYTDTVTNPTDTTNVFNVSLSAQPDSTVTVTFSSSNPSGGGSATSGASLTFTTSNWSTAQSVVVTGGTLPVNTENVAYNVTFTASGGGYDGKSKTISCTNEPYKYTTKTFDRIAKSKWITATCKSTTASMSLTFGSPTWYGTATIGAGTTWSHTFSVIGLKDLSLSAYGSATSGVAQVSSDTWARTVSSVKFKITITAGNGVKLVPSEVSGDFTESGGVVTAKIDTEIKGANQPFAMNSSKLNAFYADIFGKGFDVVEHISTYVYTSTYRSDTLQLVGNPTQTILAEQTQAVAWDRDAVTKEAAYMSIPADVKKLVHKDDLAKLTVDSGTTTAMKKLWNETYINAELATIDNFIATINAKLANDPNNANLKAALAEENAIRTNIAKKLL